MASPDGAAFAYFLMQHRAELGRKTITKVTVFRAEMDDDLAYVDPGLMFHDGNMEEEHGDDEDDEDNEEMVAKDAKVRSARTFKLGGELCTATASRIEGKIGVGC